jgi:hypothetical protein
LISSGLTKKGIRNDKEMLDQAKSSLPHHQFCLNHQSKQVYSNAPYITIFSILMLFHFTENVAIKNELKKCFNSLVGSGHLLIVNCHPINGLINIFSSIAAYIHYSNKPAIRYSA